MKCHRRSASRLWTVLFAMAIGLLSVARSSANDWTFWQRVGTTSFFSAKMATDGTNMYFSTLLDGVYRATLEDRQFTLMPMTGFPLYDANTNTNGFAVWNLAVTPQGTVLISGSPVNVTSNGVTVPPSLFNNTLPVFYYWDESGQQWHAATVTNKSYPYTTSAGNFSIAPDGAIWTCSGFASYAYRSTNEGHSYTAFDINARVPTNYFPLVNGATTLGKVFSIVVTPRNEIVVGTETGGFLHSTNQGQSWTSLDPDFTNPNTSNPLGRVGNAIVTGIDRYGDVLCGNFELNYNFQGYTNWSGVTLIGYRPADGSYYNAAQGFLGHMGPGRVFNTPSGDLFAFLNQNYLHEGGIYRSSNGTQWSQFNEGVPALTVPFAPGITNAVGQGNCITTLGNLIFIGVGGNDIWVYDSTPPPIINHPPSAIPQNLNVSENTPTNLILAGNDADGNGLTFNITVPPKSGILSGVAPDLTYTPTNNFIGLDSFDFTVNDGTVDSIAVVVNIAVNSPTNAPPMVTLLSPTNILCCVNPTNITISASASDPGGVRRVDFEAGTTRIASITNPPYVFTWTNPPVGEYFVSVKAVNNAGTRAWSTPVTVVILPALLRTKIEIAPDNQTAITWPLTISDALLETSTTLDGPWSLVASPPLDRNYSEHVVTLTNDVANQFFRLFKAP